MRLAFLPFLLFFSLFDSLPDPAGVLAQLTPIELKAYLVDIIEIEAKKQDPLAPSMQLYLVRILTKLLGSEGGHYCHL